MRPYVLINVAASADGKIDTAERRGAAVSSDADRQRVDGLRATVDGVMVGGRTLLAEDPRLVVRSAELRVARLARGQAENPAKVSLLSRPGALRADARFLTMGPARIILFVPATTSANDLSVLGQRGAEVYTTATGDDGRLDLVGVLDKLAELGLERLLVEGGGSLNFELLRLGLVDEVLLFVAPLIFGGAGAPTLADGAGLPRAQAIALTRVAIEASPDGGVLLRYMVERR